MAESVPLARNRPGRPPGPAPPHPLAPLFRAWGPVRSPTARPPPDVASRGDPPVRLNERGNQEQNVHHKRPHFLGTVCTTLYMLNGRTAALSLPDAPPSPAKWPPQAWGFGGGCGEERWFVRCMHRTPHKPPQSRTLARTQTTAHAPPPSPDRDWQERARGGGCKTHTPHAALLKSSGLRAAASRPTAPPRPRSHLSLPALNSNHTTAKPPHRRPPHNRRGPAPPNTPTGACGTFDRRRTSPVKVFLAARTPPPPPSPTRTPPLTAPPPTHPPPPFVCVPHRWGAPRHGRRRHRPTAAR